MCVYIYRERDHMEDDDNLHIFIFEEEMTTHHSQNSRIVESS